MATEYWEAEASIYDRMKALIPKNHPDLTIATNEIAILFHEKARQWGGRPVRSRVRKSNGLITALTGTEWRYIFEIPADLWQELTHKGQEALLDECLCSCLCEEDPKTAETKYKLINPDVVGHSSNIDRYGMWFPKGDVDVDKTVLGDEGDAEAVDDDGSQP